MSPDERSIGPPGDGEGRATPSPADVEKVGCKPLLANTPSITQPRHGDGLAAMRRRRADKQRRPPLGTCSCIRDPLTDRHRCNGEISDKMAQAAVAAIHTLDAFGTPGLLDRQTCEAIYRLGYRRLALDVHRRSTGQIG